MKEFTKGEIIFREGDDGMEMYRVKSGVVGVFSGYGTENETKLTELREGDFLGEMAVIEIYPRSADAVSLAEGTRLETISGDSLAAFLTRNPGDDMALMRHLSHRLRALTDDYAEVCDTLRELGRLEPDKPVRQSLMEKMKRFAAVYFQQKKAADKAETLEAKETILPGSLEDGYERRLRRCDKDDVVFRQGEEGTYLYSVVSGRVGIYTGWGTDRQKLLTELTSGHMFGEMGLVEKLPRSATAVVMERDTELELVCEDDLTGLFEKAPVRAMAILRHLSHRLRRLTLDYLKACKALAEAEEEVEREGERLSAEAQARLEYLRQVMIMPEIMC